MKEQTVATPFGEDVLIVVASYGIGCFTAGYYLFRWRTGCDIREHGSGNPGARNVGRLLGVGWFSATLLLDAGKGGLAVWLACYFGLGHLGTVAAMLAVVVGHVWPIQLHFRGGKGVAASLGAGLVYVALPNGDGVFVTSGLGALGVVALLANRGDVRKEIGRRPADTGR